MRTRIDRDTSREIWAVAVITLDSSDAEDSSMLLGAERQKVTNGCIAVWTDQLLVDGVVLIPPQTAVTDATETPVTQGIAFRFLELS